MINSLPILRWIRSGGNPGTWNTGRARPRPAFHGLFAAEAELLVERLPLISGVEFHGFDSCLVGKVQCLGQQTLGEAPSAIGNPGEYHADPCQSSSVTQQSRGRSKFAV